MTTTKTDTELKMPDDVIVCDPVITMNNGISVRMCISGIGQEWFTGNYTKYIRADATPSQQVEISLEEFISLAHAKTFSRSGEEELELSEVATLAYMFVQEHGLRITRMPPTGGEK